MSAGRFKRSFYRFIQQAGISTEYPLSAIEFGQRVSFLESGVPLSADNAPGLFRDLFDQNAIVPSVHL